MRRFFIILLLLLSLRAHIYAEYVLPYPSYMPGHKLYKVSRIIDELKKYWYWGTISSVKYHLGLSDKYIIEAKTLFEYNQYPLALDSLKRSDEQFQKIPPVVVEASQAHVALLKKLMTELPETYVWQDEYRQPISLDLHEALNRSIEIRNE